MKLLPTRYPDSVLVRENMKAYVSKSDDIETIQEKSRTIAVGEVTKVNVMNLFHIFVLVYIITIIISSSIIIIITRCSFLWERCWECEAKPRLGSFAALTRFLTFQSSSVLRSATPFCIFLALSQSACFKLSLLSFINTNHNCNKVLMNCYIQFKKVMQMIDQEGENVFLPYETR